MPMENDLFVVVVGKKKASLSVWMLPVYVGSVRGENGWSRSRVKEND